MLLPLPSWSFHSFWSSHPHAQEILLSQCQRTYSKRFRNVLRNTTNYSAILSEFGKPDIKSSLEGATHYRNSSLFSSQTKVKLYIPHQQLCYIFLQFGGILKLHPGARNMDRYKKYEKKSSNVGFPHLSEIYIMFK